MLKRRSNTKSKTSSTTAQILTASALLCGAMLALPTPSLAAEELNPPTTVSGRSGGDAYTNDCGFTSAGETYAFTLSAATSNLSATVSSSAAAADMTLTIHGPDGRTCVDDTSGGLMPSYDGPWPAGDYRVWVGDWGDSQPFDLKFE